MLETNKRYTAKLQKILQNRYLRENVKDFDKNKELIINFFDILFNQNNQSLQFDYLLRKLDKLSKCKSEQYLDTWVELKSMYLLLKNGYDASFTSDDDLPDIEIRDNPHIKYIEVTRISEAKINAAIEKNKRLIEKIPTGKLLNIRMYNLNEDNVEELYAMVIKNIKNGNYDVTTDFFNIKQLGSCDKNSTKVLGPVISYFIDQKDLISKIRNKLNKKGKQLKDKTVILLYFDNLFFDSEDIQDAIRKTFTDISLPEVGKIMYVSKWSKSELRIENKN